MSAAPAFESARLRFRGHIAADLEASIDLWSDTDAVRFISGKPATRAECWSRILRYAGHWALMGFGYWVMEEKASGRFVGEAGFGDFKRDMSPDFGGAPEHGWVLARWARGRGLATEAGLAALDWAKAHFGGGDAVCVIAPDNAPSLRVADRLGYRAYAQSAFQGRETLLLRRTL